MKSADHEDKPTEFPPANARSPCGELDERRQLLAQLVGRLIATHWIKGLGPRSGKGDNVPREQDGSSGRKNVGQPDIGIS
jgi:hypothetical protein